MNQGVINWLNFAWTSGHDFVYFYLYHLLTHFRIVKHRTTTDDRLDRIEKHLGIKEDNQ